MSNFERIVEMAPAYDKRHPDPAHNYGIHGVDLRMVLKGNEGAVQFVLFTNWHLGHVQAELDAKHGDHILCHPLPADLGYHSKVPQYDGQTPMRYECEHTGGVCYYDGSSLQAEEVYWVLVTQGSEGLWALLEERYMDLFGPKDASALSVPARDTGTSAVPNAPVI